MTIIILNLANVVIIGVEELVVDYEKGAADKNPLFKLFLET